VRARDPKPVTLQQLAARHVGRLKSYRVVAFILCWGIAEDALGHSPTLEEYGDWWRESRATTFRQQALFRDAFPGESSPQRIADLLREGDSRWYRLGVNGAAKLIVRSEDLKARIEGTRTSARRGSTDEG